MKSKQASKNMELTCMGWSLERLPKNKDKTCSLPWKHIAQGYVAHKIAQEVWTFDALSKKKQSVSFLSMSISSTFLGNWSIIYVAFFFPPSLMCEMQSTIDTTVGGAFPHRRRMFKRGMRFIVAPYPNYPKPKNSAYWSNIEMLSYITWKFKLNSSPSLC